MEKQYIATQKYLIMGPRKIRLVVEAIKKMTPVEEIDALPFVQKRAAAELSKVIKNAMASARNQGASDTDLVFKEIQIGEGPRLKRGQAASRGRWHPFKKRMSHIRVVLTTKNQNSKVKIQNEKPEKVAVEKEKKGKNGTKS